MVYEMWICDPLKLANAKAQHLMQPIWWHHCTSSMAICASKISSCKWFSIWKWTGGQTLVLRTPILATIKMLAMVRLTSHKVPNQIALKSPMVVQPSRCLLAPPLSSCRYPLSLVKQRSIHPDLDWLVTSAGEHTFLLLGWIPFFLGLDSHSIYCGFACSD